MSQVNKPADFLKSVIGKPVIVKLNSGVNYKGVLASLDGMLNIAMEQTEEYVDMMFKILQNNIPDDFVIASGKQYSIKDFVNMTCKRLNMKIKWVGKGLSEKALDKNGKKIVEISKRLFRPQDVKYLLGDSSKAAKVLKWKPKKNLFLLNLETQIKRVLEIGL